MQTDDHGYVAQGKQSMIALGRKWEALTEHDTNPIARQYKYVVCVTAGTAVMKDEAGTALTLDMAANAVLPVIPTVLTTASTGTFVGVIE